ncbi:carbon storage regulator CsrA [Paenibacillus sp. YYML68]|uniref:carbon storage regulator CsrA n=1 Tax=Paenibacillus sp. YYML68 TaxID=2909250 RepID=UPI002491826D|nr:carbon storage regulator CsrA [Paenibacillus sp. YYML68]
MLVLSRKKSEVIIVGGNIEITVLGVEGDTVKLGISAPKDIEVYRKEVFLSIQQSNKEASKNTLKLSQIREKLSKNKK